MKTTKINADFIKILKISDVTSADIKRLFSRMQKKFQMPDSLDIDRQLSSLLMLYGRHSRQLIDAALERRTTQYHGDYFLDE